MSRNLLKENAIKIKNVKLKNDFEICTIEEKKSIIRTKNLLENRIQKELKSLNENKKTEAQHNRILTEMARYERICILEAVMDDTANQLFQQASSVMLAISDFGPIAPEVASMASEKAKTMQDAVQTLQDLGSVGGGAAKDQVKKIKQIFTDLVVIFKACNTIAEAISQDDGSIKRDVLDQAINWAETSKNQKLFSKPSTLFDLLQTYDKSVKVPEKKSFFSKMFSKQSDVSSDATESVNRFSKKVEEVLKREAPGATKLAPLFISGLLNNSLSRTLWALNNFNNTVGQKVDIDLLNKLSTTGWLSSLKSFFGAAGGAGSGAGLRLF